MHPQGSAPSSPPEPAGATRWRVTDEPGGAPPAASAGAETQKPSPKGAGKEAMWVASTYFAEGLPFAIVHQVSSELFTALGASLQAVGLTAIFGFAWNGKALWSPVIDLFGTTRRWIIGLEIAVAIAVAAVAWPAGKGDLKTAAVALAAVAFLAATHDIAIDGFYIRALSKESQEAFTGLRISAYRVALLVGKGVLVGLAGLTSWSVCFLAAGGILLALSLLHALMLPREERRAGSNRLNFARAFTTFLAKPRVALIIAFIIFFRAGDALMFAMHTPLLKDLGLDTARRALVSGTLGTAASVAGSMLGALMISRAGFRRTLIPITCVQSAAILLYVWMAWARPSLAWIGAVVVVEQLVAGVGTAALMSFIMRCASGEYKASHFAIATSLMSVAMTGLGSASGFLADRYGFVYFFALAFAASLPGVALSFWAPKE
ncbi:MAG TPA: MFS transporter [Polyangiaceae bacterium]|nr:MFS transporter [Polyangiaceae bacterium]